MKDVHEIIRDVPYCGRDQPIGIETAAAIVAALNDAGYVIVAANMVNADATPKSYPFSGARS